MYRDRVMQSLRKLSGGTKNHDLDVFPRVFVSHYVNNGRGTKVQGGFDFL